MKIKLLLTTLLQEPLALLQICSFRSFSHSGKQSLILALGLLLSFWTIGKGQTVYSYTFDKTTYTNNNQTQNLDSFNWTLANDGNYYGYDNIKGQQIGSAANPAKNMALSTNEIPGTINSVKISTSGASDVNATVLVKVNGAAYSTASSISSISSTNTEYTFTGSSSGQIEIIWSQNSSKALYFKKIEVTYTTTPLFTSIATGNWEAGSTWDKGTVPTPADNVVIASGHTVTMTSVQTRDSDTSTTVNGTLATGATYTNNGTTTINGTFQLNAGGWATGNNFVYGGSSTLKFTSAYGVDNSHVYWPTSSVPQNLEVNGGLVTLNSMSRTINGTCKVASGRIEYGGSGSMLTLNGTTTINSGGYFSNSPTYGSSSKLVYNTGGTYGRGNEWTDATSGAGYPNDVQLSGNTTLNPNGGGFLANAFALARDLTIDAGSSFYMDYGGFRSTALTVGRHFSNLGNFTLGNSIGGDLKVKGNFTSTGTFDPKTQAVFLNGTSAQTISSASALEYLFVDNSAGAALTNNLTVNTRIDFSNGKISLGNYDFILGFSATITAYSTVKYFVTDGTGQLKQNVAGTDVVFPVGTTSRYNPITLKNSGTVDVIGVRVVSGTVANLQDATYAVNNSWYISEGTAGGSVLTVVPQWNTADQGTNFASGTDLKVAFYNGSAWTQNPATQAGSNPYTATGVSSFSPSTLTGTQYFTVVKSEAFVNWNIAHFRTKASGNWNVTSNWETSLDGITWKDSTKVPTSVALDIKIQNGDAIALDNASITMSNTEVYGSLEVTNKNFKVDGTGNQLFIKNGGRFIINGNGVNQGSGFGLVESGGIVEVQNFNSSPDIVSAYLEGNTSSLFTFANHSIFNWNPTTSLTLPSTGHPTIFRTQNSNDLVLFRMEKDFQNFGSGTTDNVFNAVIEMSGTKTLSVQSDKNKTFRGGIIGTGDLTIKYSSGSGTLFFGDVSTVPAWGSTGTLNITIPTTDGKIEFPNGANVPATANVIMKGDAQNKSFKRSGGHFDVFGTLDLTNLRITNSDNDGIYVKNGGILRTSHTGGLAGSGSAIPSYSGRIYLEDGSTVDYYATANQALSQALTYYHLILSGAGIKTPGAAIDVNTNGSVKITGTTTADFSTKNLASTSANSTSFTMDGGRLILGTTGTQPNMMGTYNLSGGVLEFTNNSATAQTIRNTTTYKYQNIEVTGNNVGNSSGNIALRPNGTFTVKNGGVFTVRQNSIRCYDATAGSTLGGSDCAVRVENGGTFRTNNDKGFSGYNSDFGSASSAIDSNITTITLEPDSIVDYLGETSSKIQTITTGVLSGTNHYGNLKVSGQYVAEVTGTLKVGNKVIVASHTNGATTHHGKLVIKSSVDGDPLNILYANKGVEIGNASCDLIVGNNAQLMQDIDAVNLGNITAQRVFTFSSERKQYNFIISPLVGQNIKTIYPGNPTVIYHSEAKNFFYASDGSYIPGRALAIKEPSTDDVASTASPYAAKFTRIPANGVLSYPLSYTTTNAGVDHGYNLLGNPYPSNIDLDQLYKNNEDKIRPTFSFWDNRGNTLYEQQGSAYGGANYAKYNAVNSTGISAGGIKASGAIGDERIPNQYAKVGTGFMIKALETANGQTLNFTNEIRIPNDGLPFFGKHTENEKDRYWLVLETPEQLQVMTAIVYFDQGNNAYALDDTDASDASDDLYSVVDGHKIGIQGRASFVDTDVVSLSVNAFKNQNYKIRIFKKEGVFNNGQSIYLKDRLTGVLTDLSTSEYSVNLPEGTIENRFEIVYKPESTLGVLSIKNDDLFVYRLGQDFLLRSEKGMLQKVEVYDISGRLVHTVHPQSKEYRMDGIKLLNGSYILKITRASGSSMRRIIK